MSMRSLQLVTLLSLTLLVLNISTAISTASIRDRNRWRLRNHGWQRYDWKNRDKGHWANWKFNPRNTYYPAWKRWSRRRFINRFGVAVKNLAKIHPLGLKIQSASVRTNPHYESRYIGREQESPYQYQGYGNRFNQYEPRQRW